MDNPEIMQPADSADKPKFMRGILLWLQQVATDRALPPMAASLAIVLAGFVNQRSGEAWPTQETLANALGISVRAVSRNVVALADRGHLKVVISRGRHKPNVYRPIPKNLTQTAGIDSGKPDAGVVVYAPKTGRSQQENRTRVAEKPDARDKKTGRQRPTELSNELLKEQSRELSNAHAREGDCLNDSRDGGRSGEKPRPMKGRFAGGFEEFYRVYPRHIDRGTAKLAYWWIVRNREATPADLLNGARRYAAECTGKPARYIKHPATWLKGQCWKDAPVATANPGNNDLDTIRPAGSTLIPNYWRPSQADREFAASRGWNAERIDYVAEKFRTYYQTRPLPNTGASAAWQMWVVREKDDKPKDDTPRVRV